MIERTVRAEPATTTEAWGKQLRLCRTHSHSDLLTDEFVLAGAPHPGARQYYAMVSLIDQRIGAILDLLEAQGQLDNTWIVYCSDHGEMLGDHGLMAKMNFYRSSVRVPLIVRPPGGAANRAGHVEPTSGPGLRRRRHPARAGDADPLDGAAARSLLPFVKGDGGDPRTHAISMIRMRPGMPTWHAITDGRWRVTVNADDSQPSELFDRRNERLKAVRVGSRRGDQPVRPPGRRRADEGADHRAGGYRRQP